MIVIVLIFGLLIGSFLNVCIFRIPRGEEFVVKPSHCMHCQKRIVWYDLIPVMSYVVLKGSCRHCKNKLSLQYPVVEAMHGLLYVGIYSLYGLSYDSLLMAALTSALLVIAWIDYEHMIIPDGIVVFIGGLAVLRLLMHLSQWHIYVIGFFAVSGILLLAAMLTKGGMGGGDIKLMAVAGLFLGWQQILLALMIGAIVGSVVGLALIGTKKIKRKAMIPFGPFLTFGIWIAMLFGESILNWYLTFIRI